MKCLLNVKIHYVLNIQTFSVVSNTWASSRIVPVGMHIHTHWQEDLPRNAGWQVTERYHCHTHTQTHTPALLSSAPDSTQNAFDVVSTSYLVFALRERISQHASLHFCLFLSISPQWDTLSVHLIALLSLQQSALELRYDWLEMMSSLPESAAAERAIGWQRKRWRSAEISLSFMCSWGGAFVGGWPVTSQLRLHCSGTLLNCPSIMILQTYTRMKC